MTWAIILRRWCNLDQNDAQSADCPHDIQGANFPAAWKFNRNWQKNLEFGALYQIKFFFSPLFFFAVQLCLLLPASRLDRIICGTNYPRSPECLLEWSVGQEEAEMTAERLLISRWRDGCSHPCLGWSVNHQRLLPLSAAVQPNDGRKKASNFVRAQLNISVEFVTIVEEEFCWSAVI